MNIKLVGSGPKLFILHGGPGFSHHYLLRGLSFLKEKNELIFYDQLGCGSNVVGETPVTLETTAREFIDLCRLLTKEAHPMDLIAHSWGTLVLMEALKQAPELFNLIGITLFLNPVPVDIKTYETARLNFINRLTQNTLKTYERLIVDPQNAPAIMTLLLPFYSSKPTGLSGIDFHLNLNTYLSNNANLVDFDYLDQIRQFNNKAFFYSAKRTLFVLNISPLSVMPNLFIPCHLSGTSHFMRML